jgi:hypothetical protein
LKISLLLPLVILAGMPAAQADDKKFARLKTGDDIYTNVIVTRVTAADTPFIHAGGATYAKLKDLSPEPQKHFTTPPSPPRRPSKRRPRTISSNTSNS